MAEPPRPIVAFAKDWDDDPTSNHHVLRALAQTRRVLWLNSVATRSPDLKSGRDLRRVARKLLEFARGAVNVENDLWVFTPLVLPLPHSAIALRANRRILRLTVRLLRKRLGMATFQLWSFLPNVAPYVGVMGEELSVYYCVDEWSMFSSVDAEGTAEAERALLERVDCVFAVNQALADVKRSSNRETHISSHGVDHDLFARALDPQTPIPGDVIGLPEPRIGFYGTLEDWVDLELVAECAKLRPAWTFVMIGQAHSPLNALRGLPNVHILGRRPHTELPAYCKSFSVGLIPYRISDQLPFRNPIKLREYLSAGLPVVSTAVPEVGNYRPWCTVADDASGFVAAIEAALTSSPVELRQERSRAMETETWAARVAEIARTVDEVSVRKRRSLNS